MQHLKTGVFTEELRQKLENPNLSLASWVSFVLERKVDVQVKKIETGKSFVGSKQYGYQITYSDPLMQNQLTAVRNKSDFNMLQSVLKQRFPDAAIPTLSKSEVDNLHLTALYIKELASNPFVRRDVTFIDFVNGKLRDFKHVKRNAKRMSEGSLRWLQQTTEYADVNANDEFIRTTKADLDALEKVQKATAKSFGKKINALNQLQQSSAEITASLRDSLACEQSSEKLGPGSVCGDPDGRLSANLAKMIEVNDNHMNGLIKSYDGSSLERLVIDPLTIDLKLITALRKVVDFLGTAKGDYEKAKLSEDESKESQTKVQQKMIIYEKARKALGFELMRFKTMRTVRFQELFQAYVRFNLRGTKEVSSIWSLTGVSLNQVEEDAFYTTDSFYKTTNPAINLAASRRVANPGAQVGQTMRRGVFNNAPQSSGGPPTMPTMPKAPMPKPAQPGDDDWSDDDEEKPSPSNYNTAPTPTFNPRAAAGGTLKPPSPPNNGFRPPSPPSNGGFNPPSPPNTGGGFNPPSPPSNGGGFNPPSPPSNGGGFNAPTPPNNGFRPPSPPGGGGFNPPSPPNTGGFKPPNSNTPRPPASGFNPPPVAKAFNPPPVAKAFNPPPVSQGFNPPTARPAFNPPSTTPAFNPPAMGAGPPSFGQPASKPPAFSAPAAAPPSGGNRFGGAPPPAAAMGSGKGSRNKRKKKSKGTMLGGGAPPRPAFGGGKGGGPAFLADIGKKNAVKLNKVPDAEKSKEIGGARGKGPAGAVVGGGGRGPSPPGGPSPPRMMGGGGLMGELGAKLNKRR